MTAKLLPFLQDLYCSHVTGYYGRDNTLVRGPLTDAALLGHLGGGPRVGTYFDPGDGTVRLGVIDLDNKETPDGEKPHAKRAAEALKGLGLSAEIFTSKGKGYHVPVYFAEPVPAWAVRKVLTYAATKADRPGAEIFPKQDKMDVYIPPAGSKEPARVGSYINLPFHGEGLPTGRTALLNKANGMAPYPDQAEAAGGIKKNSAEDLVAALAMIGEDSIPPPAKIAPPVEKIISEKRNIALTSLVGTLRRRGLNEEEILPSLLVVNKKRCDPPLDESEVRGIAKSISKYPAAGPIANEAVKPTTERKPLFDDVGRTLRTGGIPSPKWLVKRLIERGLIQIFGPTGSMKSFIIMLLSYASVTGGKFFGRVVESGPVVYICGEGRAGAYRRFLAHEMYFGITIPDDLLFLSNRAVNLDLAGADTLRDEIQAVTVTAGCPPVMIVIDTMSRTLVGDENSPKDMAEFVNAADALAAKFGCSIIVIHHTGHSQEAQNRGRGSSVFGAACDTIIKCHDQKLTWTKTKDSEPPEPIPFAFEKVDLGHDEDGEVIDTLVIVEAEAGATTHTGNLKITPGERLALETLIETSAKGELRDGRWWTGVDEWRVEYAKRYWQENPKTKEKAHIRDRKKLVEKGLITVDNDCYAVIRHEDAARVQDLVTIGPIVRSMEKTGDRRHLETIGDIVSAQMETSGDTPCKGVSLSPVPPPKKGGKRS